MTKIFLIQKSIFFEHFQLSFELELKFSKIISYAAEICKRKIDFIFVFIDKTYLVASAFAKITFSADNWFKEIRLNYIILPFFDLYVLFGSSFYVLL